MNTKRDYQYHFSSLGIEMHNSETRRRKAATMIATLKDYCDSSLQSYIALDIGASTGIIDDYLSDHLGAVIGIDIDSQAIEFANENFNKNNLDFIIGDAINTCIKSMSIDIVICSQIYEHVPNPEKMLEEIYRVLKPGGVCYFAATNRIMWNEPHYNLPLLSVLPRPLAHTYIRMSGKASHYHELHYSYWGLKNLVSKFHIVDYTKKIIKNPDKFDFVYMINPGTLKHMIANTIAKHFFWLVPGYIWLLKKPGKLTPTLCDAT